jgi:hypothetical protein
MPGPIDRSVYVDDSSTEFDGRFLPQLDAAYSLARVMMRSVSAAFRAFSGFRGEATRLRLLAVVPNTFLLWLYNNRYAVTPDTQKDEHIPGCGS